VLTRAGTLAADLPPLNTQAQDEVFARAFEILEEGVRQKAFPAASLAITRAGRIVALKAIGGFTYDEHAPRVTTESIFDLASVTKVIATTGMAMILWPASCRRSPRAISVEVKLLSACCSRTARDCRHTRNCSYGRLPGML
jgi:Beta-lactamase